VELAVGIAIVAIIAGFAAGGNIQDWVIQRGLNSAVEQLRGDMQRAKLLAIEQQANCSILIDTPGTNQYTIASAAGNRVMDLGDYPGNVTFVGGSSAVITFNAWGICTTAGQITLTNQRNLARYRLRTSIAGGISKQVWNGSNWIKSNV
jgi:Tfp pilus assembly protein FimT